jgi:hypothetical protein
MFGLGNAKPARKVEPDPLDFEKLRANTRVYKSLKLARARAAADRDAGRTRAWKNARAQLQRRKPCSRCCDAVACDPERRDEARKLRGKRVDGLAKIVVEADGGPHA